MHAVQGPRLLGLFNMGNLSFDIDRWRTKEPSLAEMTVKTLHMLSQRKEGFFAMIEGGRIDHAAHRNDAVAAIRDVLAFDDAVGVAMDFARRHRDAGAGDRRSRDRWHGDHRQQQDEQGVRWR